MKERVNRKSTEGRALKEECHKKKRKCLRSAGHHAINHAIGTNYASPMEGEGQR